MPVQGYVCTVTTKAGRCGRPAREVDSWGGRVFRCEFHEKPGGLRRRVRDKLKG